MNQKLKNKILDWMCLNCETEDLLDSSINHFRKYIFDKNNNFIKSGKEVFNFIVKTEKSISANLKTLKSFKTNYIKSKVR